MAPTLNLLIAPIYAWVAGRTGNLRLLDQGDRIFAGGVKHANLEGGKHFNQNYRWSFAYVSWRASAGVGEEVRERKPRDGEEHILYGCYEKRASP